MHDEALQAWFEPEEFDIDVALATDRDGVLAPVHLDARWYELVQPNRHRSRKVQHKLDRLFANAMRQAQWRAARQRRERRRAVRAPLLSRVRAERHDAMLACDISLSGIRCSGRPERDVLELEFKLPGLDFPVNAKAEVVSFADRPVIPLAGMQFVDIDPGYLEHIDRYVRNRTEAKQRRAA